MLVQQERCGCLRRTAHRGSHERCRTHWKRRPGEKKGSENFERGSPG
jgi:hypothetical protein